MAPKTFVGRAVAQRSDTFEKTCVREGLGQVSAGADNTVWAGATEPGFDLKRAIRAQQVETGSENPIITCSSSELCFNIPSSAERAPDTSHSDEKECVCAMSAGTLGREQIFLYKATERR